MLPGGRRRRHSRSTAAQACCHQTAGAAATGCTGRTDQTGLSLWYSENLQTRQQQQQQQLSHCACMLRQLTAKPPSPPPRCCDAHLPMTLHAIAVALGGSSSTRLFISTCACRCCSGLLLLACWSDVLAGWAPLLPAPLVDCRTCQSTEAAPLSASAANQLSMVHVAATAVQLNVQNPHLRLP